MYREMGRVAFKFESAPSVVSTCDISAWTVLLQAWCLKRFSTVSRRVEQRRLRGPGPQASPRLARCLSILSEILATKQKTKP
ncbi:hypothetical protein LINGRAHAP2_LOCUS24131 [Linum grandiflorum]